MPKILIVDDSDVFRIQLKNILEEEHEVIEACNGVEGLAKIVVHKDLQLIICDLNMPEMDGITMCQKVKEIEQFKNIPILMCTTESTHKLKEAGKKAGVTAWIVKPYNPNNISTVVSKIVEKFKTN